MANYKISDTQLTAVANAIREKSSTNTGLTFPDGFISAIGNISGGSSNNMADGDVVFIDYDGTVVATKTKAEINAMSSDSDLPANPTHSGLTSQGWNWTVAQLKAQLTAMPDQKVYVGQMYVTASGATEIDVEMQEGRLSPILTIALNGTVSVDWGDNTTPDSVTGNTSTSRYAVPHTYTQAGHYTIKVSAISGTYSFYGTNKYPLLRKNTTTNENRVYTNCIKAIRIGNGITTINDYAFYGSYSLSSITIPSGVTTIGNYAFIYCYSLLSITIPSEVTTINTGILEYCYSLTGISIPSGITSIKDGAFYYCYSLPSITIPSGVTTIEGSVFYYCYSLKSVAIPSGVTSIASTMLGACFSLSSITIPSGVTNIGENAFNNSGAITSITIPSGVTNIGGGAFTSCYGVAEYHILPTIVPTAGSSIFGNMSNDCIIYVPQGKLNDYQTATNWVNYASHMREEPT